MLRLHLRAPSAFESGFAAIRAELDVPPAFPPEVLEAAEAAQDAMGLSRRDATEIAFVAIDPPGATDLDQAFAADRLSDGYRVYYAIADVGAFLAPGGVIDLEARQRGTTLYSPDIRTPLHPPVISEDRASLLPGSPKPALLWTIDLDDTGEPVASHLERATVEIREAITYTEAQRRIDGGDGQLGLLAEIGTLRQEREQARGGISLNLPDQEVVADGESYTLRYDETLPVEGWNAQISLLTGIVAGHKMYEAGVGILRTLPASRSQDLRTLRRQAKALGIDWPDHVDYPTLVRSIEPTTPSRCAFLLQAARSFRGAGYVAFNVADPDGPGERPERPEHGAIASIYAHVTAPLRRLVDRFGNEILLALYAGEDPPAWAVEALGDLPSHMGRARSKDGALEKAMVNFAEATMLAGRVGEQFEGFVIDLDERRSQAVIQITEPAVVTEISDPGSNPGSKGHGLQLAQRVSLRLEATNPTDRTLSFSVIGTSE